MKAYFALKLAGVPADDPRMAAARERVLALGGIQQANSYVKINLSLFGLYPREQCPSVPPEMILLPGKFLYRMSSWTRAIVVPLAIVHSHAPARPVPAGFTLEELFLPGVEVQLPASREAVQLAESSSSSATGWSSSGSGTEFESIRRKAIRECERWMLERTRYTDGLGAIYPPMMYVIMALDLLGLPAGPSRPRGSREPVRAADGGRRRAVLLPALLLGGVGHGHRRLCAGRVGARAGRPHDSAPPTGCCRKRCGARATGPSMRPNLEPSGWYFEYANEFYPDIDDTAMVLLALRHAKARERRARSGRRKSAPSTWLLGMQSKDGGWAAFDVDNNWTAAEPTCRSPITTPCSTRPARTSPGRVLEAICASGGLGPDHPAVRRGVAYLIKNAGGRWKLVRALGRGLRLRHVPGPARAEGGGRERPRGGRSCGPANGCARPERRRRVGRELRELRDRTPSCPRRARRRRRPGRFWACSAGGDIASLSVRKGIEYLVRTQRDDGGWDEQLATGTGFPRCST